MEQNLLLVVLKIVLSVSFMGTVKVELLDLLDYFTDALRVP